MQLNNLVKVEHRVVLNKEVTDTLFTKIVNLSSATYNSELEQATALAPIKIEYDELLTEIASQSFKTGKKVGKFKADSKDTAMYSKDGK